MDVSLRASLDSISNKEHGFDICPIVIKLFLTTAMGYVGKPTIFVMGLQPSCLVVLEKNLKKSTSTEHPVKNRMGSRPSKLGRENNDRGESQSE